LGGEDSRLSSTTSSRSSSARTRSTCLRSIVCALHATTRITTRAFSFFAIALVIVGLIFAWYQLLHLPYPYMFRGASPKPFPWHSCTRRESPPRLIFSFKLHQHGHRLGHSSHMSKIQKSLCCNSCMIRQPPTRPVAELHHWFKYWRAGMKLY
jgi:hypothetical protein